MLTHIQHPKLNTGISYIYSKSDEKQECVQKTDYNSEQKNITRKQSASANFTGGFFSPKNRDSVSFAGTSPKKDFWSKLGENEKIKKFIRSKKFDSILKKANDLALTESLIMFGIAVTIKPLTIMLVPGAKEEDKRYAATKALLGGSVDFAIATIFITPVTKVLEKFNELAEKNPKLITDKVSYLKDPKNLKNFKKITEYGPKFLLVPVRSLLTIALIPPTLKYLFPDEAKKLKPKATHKGGSK